MHWRLSILMFLLYAPLGALVPLFTVRLGELGFSPAATGWACATQALGALLAPLLLGQVADRWVAADRCLALCLGLSSLFLWLLAEAATPGQVFGLALAYWLAASPTMSLGATLTLRNLPAREQFGTVRVWGTVGWVAIGWLVGLLFRIEGLQTGDTFRLGAGVALLAGLYALTLPRTPPAKVFTTLLAPLGAIRLLRRRGFAIFFACACLYAFTAPFYTQNLPLFLRERGIRRQWLTPLMTVAQSTEIVALFFMSWILARLGMRRTILLGLAAWATVLTVLACDAPLPLVVISLGGSGILICCFFVAGQVFLDGEASGDVRASVQALFQTVNGVGMLFGHLGSGVVREAAAGRFGPTFAVAASLALLAVALFAFGFPSPAELAVEPSPG